MICNGFKQDSCSKSGRSLLFRLSVETPTSKVLVYDLLAILEKQDAEQLQVFKAKCDKAVVAESKTVHEMEVKSLEAEKVRLEEKKTARQNAAKKKKDDACRFGGGEKVPEADGKSRENPGNYIVRVNGTSRMATLK